MSVDSHLVAFILGAGSNVGASLAAKLKDNGYRVALGSRNPQPRADSDEAYLNIQVDVTKRESIESAFDTVVEKLGPVNVVIYNAVVVHFPENENDVLSLPVSSYEESVALGIGAFTAAQKALPSFKNDIHRDHPKSFIVTGNTRPFNHYTPPKFFTLGIQKVLEARLVATAAKSYETENFQFYFATLVSETGGIPDHSAFTSSGPTHAKVYWELINNKKQAAWDHRFTLDGNTYSSA